MTNKWPLLALDDVARLEYGTRVTRKKDGGTIYPVYGGGGATFRLDEWNREDCYIISRFAMSRECVRFVPGRFFLNDSGLTVSTRDSNSLTQKFLDRFLLAKSGDIFDLSRGTAQRNLDVPAFRMLAVPLPPLGEQKRIVAKLDAAQQQFDRLNNNLEQQLSQLTDFDSALLSEMLGKPQQTPEPTVTRKWSNVFLGDIVNVQGGYAFKSSEYSDSGHYLIRIANVIDNQVIQTDDKYVDLESEPRLKRFALEVGDLLMTLTGNIGRTAIVNLEVLPAALNQRVARIHADKKITSNEFLQYLFNSDAFIQYILGAGHGAAQQNVSTKDLESFQFPLPPLDEQKRIVATLDEASLASSSLRLNIIGRKKSASDLQSSILTAAFAGAL